MGFIKGLAKLISTLSSFAFAYLMLAYTNPSLLIGGLTPELALELIPVVIAVGGVASLISDGIKKAILSVIIEGVISGVFYLLNTLVGNAALTTLILYAVILIVFVPIIIYRIAKGKIKVVW